MTSNTETLNITSVGIVVDHFEIITDPSNKRLAEYVLNLQKHPYSVVKQMVSRDRNEITDYLLQLHFESELSKVNNLVLKQQLEILQPELLFVNTVLKVQLRAGIVLEFDSLNDYSVRFNVDKEFANFTHQLYDWDLLQYHKSIQQQLLQQEQIRNVKEIELLELDSQRRQLLHELLRKPFLLEFGPDFVSYLIIIQVENNSTNEVIGSAVVNVHFRDYPQSKPKVMMQSPLYFDSVSSNMPACKRVEYDFVNGPVNLVESIFQNLGEQIVNFHSVLVQNGNS